MQGGERQAISERGVGLTLGPEDCCTLSRYTAGSVSHCAKGHLHRHNTFRDRLNAQLAHSFSPKQGMREINGSLPFPDSSATVPSPSPQHDACTPIAFSLLFKSLVLCSSLGTWLLLNLPHPQCNVETIALFESITSFEGKHSRAFSLELLPNHSLTVEV